MFSELVHQLTNSPTHQLPHYRVCPYPSRYPCSNAARYSRLVNRRGGYSNYAAQVGYRDGVYAGRSDARDRARFDPVRAKRYREGDHDYNGRYGDRETYKREYRASFEQGYREGYGQRR